MYWTHIYDFGLVQIKQECMVTYTTVYRLSCRSLRVHVLYMLMHPCTKLSKSKIWFTAFQDWVSFDIWDFVKEDEMTERWTTYIYIPKGPDTVQLVKISLYLASWRKTDLQTKDSKGRSEFHLVRFKNSKTPSTSTLLSNHYREDYKSSAGPFYSIVQAFPDALQSD